MVPPDCEAKKVLDNIKFFECPKAEYPAVTADRTQEDLGHKRAGG